MRHYRRRGDRNEPGETRAEIFYFLLDHPTGIDEYAIREYIHNTLSIRDPRSVRNQLEKLKSDELVSCEHERWTVLKPGHGWDGSTWDMREFWIALDFETKLRILPKRIIQDFIDEELYPAFIAHLEYAPTMFIKRLNELKSLGDQTDGNYYEYPSIDRNNYWDNYSSELDLIRESFKYMPSQLDFQLSMRPEIDLMLFNLVATLPRIHPEEVDRYFTPKYLGALSTIVALYYFGRDLNSSETLHPQVHQDYDRWIALDYLERFTLIFKDIDYSEVRKILRITGLFTNPAIDEYRDRIYTELPSQQKLPSQRKSEVNEGLIQQSGRSSRCVFLSPERENFRVIGEKWMLLAGDWPGRGIVPRVKEGE